MPVVVTLNTPPPPHSFFRGAFPYFKRIIHKKFANFIKNYNAKLIKRSWIDIIPLVKIYTRGGDKGDTSLIGGKRVSKYSTRINAYGNVDELNAALGVAISFLDDPEVKKLLERIQNELFIVGSDLADPSYPDSTNKTPRVTDAMVKELESVIDKYDQEVGEIQYFILPGGSKAASLLHLARGIARRAERNCVELSNIEKINPAVISYLNRLSDLLFMLARVINKRMGVNDVAWHG